MSVIASPPALAVRESPVEFVSFHAPVFDRFLEFGDLIHDYNPLHRNAAYALERKCDAPPVFGIALGALTDLALKESNYLLFSPYFPGNFVHAQSSLKFSNPVYADEAIQLTNCNLKLSDGNPVLHFKAINSKGPIFSGWIKAQADYPSFTVSQGPSLIDYQQEITHDAAVRFYELLRMKPQAGVSPYQIAAQIPAALLELSRQRSGTVQGTSRGIDLEFFAQPIIGKYRTEIRLLNSRGSSEKGFAYSVEGVCYKDELPIVRGSFMVLHPCDLR